MKIISYLLILSSFLLASCSTIPSMPTTTPATTDTPLPALQPTVTDLPQKISALSDVNDCPKIVNAITEFTSLHIPISKRESTDFDANRYFDVLTHIAIQKGYTLDYVPYNSGGTDSEPLLYVRPVSQKPYETVTELVKALGGEISDYLFPFTVNGLGTGAVIPKYLDYVVVEDNSDGYFEYAVFMQTIEQFYLYGIPSSNDGQIVCDDAKREKIIAEWSTIKDVHAMTADIAEQARKADLAPVVRIENDKVQVQLVMFSQFSGFYRAFFTVSRSFPHKVIAFEREVFAPYNSGVLIATLLHQTIWI